MKYPIVFGVCLVAFQVMSFAGAPEVKIGYLPPDISITKNFREAAVPFEAEAVPEDRPVSRHIDLRVKRSAIDGDPKAKDLFKTGSYVCVSELKADEAGKYPTITKAARELNALLADRPAAAAFYKCDAEGVPVRDLPDFPFPDAYQAIRAHFGYLDAPWGSGYGVVVQFAQDTTRANNEELCYYFQGITKDGRYYVSANFALAHPKLPLNYEAAEKTDPKGTTVSDMKLLQSWPASSFTPSVDEIRKLLGSLEIEGK